jgi:hypothetical protein
MMSKADMSKTPDGMREARGYLLLIALMLIGTGLGYEWGPAVGFCFVGGAFAFFALLR